MNKEVRLVIVNQGVLNLGDTRGLNSVIYWGHLYKWGDAIDVRGDADTKRLGTPDLNCYVIIKHSSNSNLKYKTQEC